MSSINLVHRYVVEQILSIKTKCEFKNYGGTSRGLIDRIMASFHIPETGWLQDLYTNKKLNIEKVRLLIIKKFDEDQLEDIIDIWKELCNKGYIDLTIMDIARQFEADIRNRGFGQNPFFELKVSSNRFKLKTVDNAIKSAIGYFEKTVKAPNPKDFDDYQMKLLRTLATYPYIHEVFVETAISKSYFEHLRSINDSSVRASTLIAKIKEENESLIKEVKSKQLHEDVPRMMHEIIKKMHPPAKPYIQFLGTEHLLSPVFKWDAGTLRSVQEISMCRNLFELVKKGDKGSIRDLKALIHRSSQQRLLCIKIICLPKELSILDKLDPTERGIVIDELLDGVVNLSKKQGVKDPLPSFPKYPNLTEEEEFVSQPKVNASDKKVVIKGDPADPVVKKLAEIFNIDIDDVKPSEIVVTVNKIVKEFEDGPLFKSQLFQGPEQGKTGMDNVDKIIKISKELDDSFKALTGIDPSMLYNDSEDLHSHQQRVVDGIVGINPGMEGHIGFINPNSGKQRSEAQYDFSGLFKFLEDHYGSKPTATEIETSTNVVINQKFVVYDIKGEFFCEYKMTWTPNRTQFMFTHDKPGDEVLGRRFYPIRDLNKQMTQDEAFAQFQSLRRDAISDGPHKPKVNPFTGY